MNQDPDVLIATIIAVTAPAILVGTIVYFQLSHLRRLITENLKGENRGSLHDKAITIHKAFSSREDTEGVMLMEAVIKRIPKRGRPKKSVPLPDRQA